MKTTLDIADPLFEEAKRIAARDGETLRSLVEQGLREVIAQRQRKPKPFKLADGSFMGTGVSAEFEGASWEKIREAIYEGHGG